MGGGIEVDELGVAYERLLGEPATARESVLVLRQGLPTCRVAVVPPPRPRGARTIAIATWDAPAPDLLVIDRGAARGPVAVRIYSGESGFRKLLLAVALPGSSRTRNGRYSTLRGFRGQRPEILLVKCRGPSGEEVHFLSGNAFFAAFDQHLAVPARPISPGDQVVIGTRVGQATAYVVSLAGRARTVSLMSLPYPANVPS